MNFPILTPELIEAFILVLVRISSMISMIPVFGENAVPSTVKWGLSLLISMMLFPIVKSGIAIPADLGLLPMVMRIAGEILIGVTIGFTARLIFAGIQLAGEMLGFQMGFSIANVIDPASNMQVSIIAEFQYLLAMLVFLTVDAHHIFLNAIAESYWTLSLFNVRFSGELLQVMIQFSKDMFVIAIKISAPVMAVLLFTNVAMGVVARTVPQMNIFVVSFPLQIAMGLLFIGFTAPVFVKLLQHFFLGLTGEVNLLFRFMR